MSNVGYIKREGMCLSSTMRYRMRQREHIPRLYNEDADRQKKGKRWDELAEEFVNLALAVAGRGWKVGWKGGCSPSHAARRCDPQGQHIEQTEKDGTSPGAQEHHERQRVRADHGAERRRDAHVGTEPSQGQGHDAEFLAIQTQIVNH